MTMGWASDLGRRPNFCCQRRAVATLVANRVGQSHTRDCVGGTAVYDATGRIVVEANRAGQEEILYYALPRATRRPGANDR